MCIKVFLRIYAQNQNTYKSGNERAASFNKKAIMFMELKPHCVFFISEYLSDGKSYLIHSKYAYLSIYNILY